MTDQADSSSRANAWKLWSRVIVLGLVAAAFLFGLWSYGDELTLEKLAQRESQLQIFQNDYPVVVFGVAFLIYVAVTALSLPGATVLTLVYGWYFGFLRALVLVSFASTIGATLAFLLVRFLFRDIVRSKFGKRLQSFNESLETEGPFFLFTLRLIPAVPFFVINAVMGLTPIRTWTFYWISQLGMLPGTIVYVYAGSSVPNLQTLAESGINAVFNPAQLVQIVAAFVLLGVFPLAVRWGMKWYSKKSGKDVSVTRTGNGDSQGN